MGMRKINFTAFDFETATANRMPCQLGVAVVRDGEIVEKKCWLIKPPDNRYDNNCSRVHGITALDTERSIEFCGLWEEIKPYFHHELIVAHNLQFDADVLDRIVDYYQLNEKECIPLAGVCTMRLFHNEKLSEVTNTLGIEFNRHHNALDDAVACAKIYLAYLNGTDPDEMIFKEKKKRNTFLEDKNRKLSHDVKIQDLSCVECSDTVFYNQKVVITGVFDHFPVREKLALYLKKLGADINTSISQKTNYVIAGRNCGPAKLEKIVELQQQGNPIRIIGEDELLKILTEKTQ
jgi:DNA polymerase-3 subunit epsilon